MLTPREFLLQECRNVEELLRDALRYEYGPGGSQDFFDECFSRLRTFKAEAEDLTEADAVHIGFFARQLSDLSQLISQIERSHIGEFPWAFGESLRNLAEQILTDKGLAGVRQVKKPGQPLVFIMAEGGLSAFEARKDANHPDFCNRRVYTVVVPRSLKHHVLLHAVLGHEVCHSAIWTKLVGRISLAAKPIRDQVEPLTSNKRLRAWLEEHYTDLEEMDGAGDDMRKAWIRELTCDLFGLILMGPGYFAAVRSMLGLSDPTGLHIDSGHPPHVWRYQLLEHAYKVLGWNEILPASVNQSVREAQKKFDAKLLDYDHDKLSTETVVPLAAVRKATLNLKKFLDDLGDFSYKPPKPEVLQTLIEDLRSLRPPIGQSVDEDKIVFADADFRHVLHAGWMACHADVAKDWPKEEKKNEFTIINRLCEQAMVQSKAISLVLPPPAASRKSSRRKKVAKNARS